MERLWSPWRLDYVTGSKADVGCVFCTEQTLPESESLIVHTGSQCYVILNRFPYNPGHLMVLPTRHIPALAAHRLGILSGTRSPLPSPRVKVPQNWGI